MQKKKEKEISFFNIKEVSKSFRHQGKSMLEGSLEIIISKY